MIASTRLPSPLPAPAEETTACRAAALHRRSYLRELTTGQRPLSSAMGNALAAHVARLAVITSEVFGACELAHYAWWLGMDIAPARAGHISDSALEEFVQHTIATLPDPHCALLAAIAADCEHLLEQPGAWQPSLLRPPAAAASSGLGTGSWLALAVQLGYQPTAWETQRMDAAQPGACHQHPEDSR